MTWSGSSRSGLLQEGWGPRSQEQQQGKQGSALSISDTDSQHLNKKSRIGLVMTTRVSQQLSDCQTRPQQWGPRSKQVVKSAGQDHHPSSNATPKPKGGGGQDLYKASHSSLSHRSLNRNLIQSYTGVSYHSSSWAPAAVGEEAAEPVVALKAMADILKRK